MCKGGKIKAIIVNPEEINLNTLRKCFGWDIKSSNQIRIDFDQVISQFKLLHKSFIHCVFLFYFLSQSLNFRKSKNLNRRVGEILYISDKMKIYSLFNWRYRNGTFNRIYYLPSFISLLVGIKNIYLFVE